MVTPPSFVTELFGGTDRNTGPSPEAGLYQHRDTQATLHYNSCTLQSNHKARGSSCQRVAAWRTLFLQSHAVGLARDATIV